MTPKEAKRIAAVHTLANCKVQVGADFHTLEREQVDLLLEHAVTAKYRKPRNASGSLARCFHDMLQRRACART